MCSTTPLNTSFRLHTTLKKGRRGGGGGGATAERLVRANNFVNGLTLDIGLT